MSLKNVLLHVSAENLDTTQGPVPYALGVASAFNAYLLSLVFELDVYSPTGAYYRELASDGRAAVEARNRVALIKAEDLRQAALSAGVLADVITARVHAHDVPAAVADRARLYDLSILGNVATELLNDRSIAEYVLFQSGRPIIVVPRNVRSFAAERIVVAWDHTRAAARALADAMPLLERAAEVWIVTFSDEKRIETSLTADDLAVALARHGIDATYETVPVRTNISDAIVGYASQYEADLLVMGGYGHSRFREFVLGGATRGILGAATMPVFMSH